jgi:hypothetical protein
LRLGADDRERPETPSEQPAAGLEDTYWRMVDDLNELTRERTRRRATRRDDSTN